MSQGTIEKSKVMICSTIPELLFFLVTYLKLMNVKSHRYNIVRERQNKNDHKTKLIFTTKRKESILQNGKIVPSIHQ